MAEVAEANAAQIARKAEAAAREREDELAAAAYLRQRDAREQARGGGRLVLGRRA